MCLFTSPSNSQADGEGILGDVASECFSGEITWVSVTFGLDWVIQMVRYKDIYCLFM